MKIKTGSILTSTPSTGDTNFDDAAVLIVEYNEKGVLGFVFNQLFPRRFNELEEFKHSPAFPLYDGGPMDREHLYFIHRRPDLIEGGSPVFDNVYFGGNFKQAVTHINNNNLPGQDIKIFIGYCGWDPGQLEEEIGEGSWMITDTMNIF